MKAIVALFALVLVAALGAMAAGSIADAVAAWFLRKDKRGTHTGASGAPRSPATASGRIAAASTPPTNTYSSASARRTGHAICSNAGVATNATGSQRRRPAPCPNHGAPNESNSCCSSLRGRASVRWPPAR